MAWIEVHEFYDVRGASPFGEWFRQQESVVQDRLTLAIFRLQSGNTSAAKAVGGGVHELRLFFGPGFRVYFARDGERLVLLLGGGTKARQDKDIQAAQKAWREYKEAKLKEKQ